MFTPSSQHSPESARSWWFSSVESTLAWPSLRPYHLLQVPLTSIVDMDDETDPVGLHADPRCASLRLAPHLHGAHAAPSRGALDDKAEMTRLVDAFIKHIHAKQPLIDTRLLYSQIALVQEEGLGWDAATCLLVRWASISPAPQARPHAAMVLLMARTADSLRAGRYLHPI